MIITQLPDRSSAPRFTLLSLLIAVLMLPDCEQAAPAVPTLHWYVVDEPSGAFAAAAEGCSTASGGAYRVVLRPLPTDADHQDEQLVRRQHPTPAQTVGQVYVWIV